MVTVQFKRVLWREWRLFESNSLPEIAAQNLDKILCPFYIYNLVINCANIDYKNKFIEELVKLNRVTPEVL